MGLQTIREDREWKIKSIPNFDYKAKKIDRG